MKKSLMALAVCASVAGGALTYQQMQLQQLVQSQVQQLVAGIDGTPVLEETQLKAVLSHHNAGMLESDGLITVTIAGQAGTQFDIRYRVNHGVTTAISGATYTAEITNPVLDGDPTETITQKLFNGQPVMVAGLAQATGVNGVVTIPAIDVKEQSGQSLQTQPARIDFVLADFDGTTYTKAGVDLHIPTLALQDSTEALELAGLKLHLVSNENQPLNGELNLSLDRLRVQPNGTPSEAAGTLSDFVITSNTHISEQLQSDFSISAKSISMPTHNLDLTDFALGYRVSGIDGETVKQAILRVKESTEQGLSEEQMGEQLINLIRQRADQQLAYNPTFEVDRFHITQGGQQLFDVKGKVSILGDKVPANYLSSVINQQIEPDPAVALQASVASLDATLSDTAAMMLSMFNPELSQLVQQAGNKISFKLENGEGVFNGRRIL